MAHIHYYFTDVRFLAESRKSACCHKAGAMVPFTQNVLTLNTPCESHPPLYTRTLCPVYCGISGSWESLNSPGPLPSVLWHILSLINN